MKRILGIGLVIFATISTLELAQAYHNCASPGPKMRVIAPGEEIVLWSGHNFEGFVYVHLQTDKGPGGGLFRVVDKASNEELEVREATEFATFGITAPKGGVEIRVKFEAKTLCIPCSKITDHKSAQEVYRQWSTPSIRACGTNIDCVKTTLKDVDDSHSSVFWPELKP